MTVISGNKIETDVSQNAVTLSAAGATWSVAVQGTTATTGTFTAGTGTTAVSGSSWVGNAGTKAYTVSDIVSALKAAGILTS